MEKQQSSTLTMPATPEATSAALALLYAKDADFRAEFDKDPKAAIAKASGQEVPSNVEIVVHRNDPKRWHVTLPVEGMDAALDDADIENIAGGTAPGAMATAVGFMGMALGVCSGLCTEEEAISSMRDGQAPHEFFRQNFGLFFGAGSGGSGGSSGSASGG